VFAVNSSSLLGSNGSEIAFLQGFSGTPNEFVAFEEALFREAEAGQRGELLWLREAKRHFVVLGSSRPAHADVDLGVCQATDIPVVRRFSGGGTVLQGPGSLCFTLLLKHDLRPEVASGVQSADRYVLSRMMAVLAPLIGAVEMAGVCDLTANGKKFAGNAQRRGRVFTLYHGSILNGLDLDLMSSVLRLPDRRPEYRGARAHHEFVRNLELPPSRLEQLIRRAWSASLEADPPGPEAVRRLVTERYGRAEWTYRF
jgi:lipoate-protein ligase A